MSCCSKTGIWQTFPKSEQITQIEQNVDPILPFTHVGAFHKPIPTFAFCHCSVDGCEAELAFVVNKAIVIHKSQAI